MSAAAEKSKAILETAYKELYSGIVEGQFPEWYVQGLPSYAKSSFDNGEPRDVAPRFIETLGLKAAQEVLESNGNARSVIAANDSIKGYGQLLFSMKHAKPDTFKDEPRYPIDAAACHDLALRSIGVKYDELDPLFQQALGDKYEAESFKKGPEQTRIEDVISRINHATNQVQAIAAGSVGIKDGTLVSTKSHPRVGGRKDSLRIADIPPGTLPGQG